jgi:hypothetical protein
MLRSCFAPRVRGRAQKLQLHSRAGWRRVPFSEKKADVCFNGCIWAGNMTGPRSAVLGVLYEVSQCKGLGSPFCIHTTVSHQVSCIWLADVMIFSSCSSSPCHLVDILLASWSIDYSFQSISGVLHPSSHGMSSDHLNQPWAAGTDVNFSLGRPRLL